MRISDWSSDVCSSDLQESGHSPDAANATRLRPQLLFHLHLHGRSSALARRTPVVKKRLRQTCGFDSIRRMVQSSRAFGENFAARFRNPDAVFELGRQRSIAGDGGPSVLQHLHAGLADIDHRLDGEEQAGLQFRTVARAADMHDFGRVVKDPAKAMTTEVADNTVPEF